MNRWENHSTWAVYTWLTNDPATEEAAARAAAQGAQVLKQMVEDLVLPKGACEAHLASDLLDWVLDEVDWDSLSAALREGE